MSPSILIIGAGPGLGRAVARRYAREGYDLALVARRSEPLRALADELSGEGANASPLAADITDPAAREDLVGRVTGAIGVPDVIYYSAPMRGFAPVVDLTSAQLRELMPIALYALVDLVHAFLPRMRERGSGAILSATGPSPILPLPQLSAAAGLAAQRNYLQALQTAVSAEGIFVGRLFCGATIRHSAFHAQQEAAQNAGRPVVELPLVEPDTLADVLWDMQATGETHEVAYPPQLLDA